MSKQQHTPGPWVARQCGGNGYSGQVGWAIDFNEDQEQVVDYVYEEADARLIAAAPDLLEALENQLRSFESQHAMLLQMGAPDFVALQDQARAAIAKARGES